MKLSTAILALWATSIFVSVSVVPIVQILILVSAIILWREGRYPEALPGSLLFLGAFALAGIVATAANHADLLDAGKNWGRFKYPLAGIVMWWVMREWWKKAEQRSTEIILTTILGTVCLSCFYGIAVYVFKDQERLRGFTGTLRFGYGMALVLVCLFAAYPFFRSTPLKQLRVLYWITYVLAVAALFLASTRGAMLGWLSGTVVVGIFSSARWMRVCSLFAALLAGTFALIYLFAPESWDHKLIGTRHRASDGVRFGQWKAAVMAIQEKPILGHGPANVTPQLDRIKNQHNHTFAWYSGHSHNTFLEVAAGTGVVGLSAFLLWLAAWALESFKAGGILRCMGLGTITYLLVAGQFEVMLDANNSTLIFLLWASMASYGMLAVKRINLALPQVRLGSVTTAAVFFLAIGTFTSVSIQGVYQVLMVVPLLYYVWLAKGRAFRLPASAWWMIGFSVVALISIGLNWDLIPRPSKNIGRIKYFLMAAFGVFPIGVWLRSVSNRTKNRLERWFYVSVIVAALWIMYQGFVLNAERIKPFTETMRYAYGTALIILLGLGLALHPDKTKSWYSRRWAWLGLSFALVATVLVNSRGAQASIILGLPLLLWFWNRKLALAFGLVCSIAGSFVVWNYFYGTSNQTKVRILDNSSNASDQIRRSQWKSAFIAWKEKPLLGWGFSNFHTQVKRIKHENDLPTKDYVDAHAHNIPLEIAAGTGLIGLAFFLTAFFCWVWECWRLGGMTRILMMPFFAALMFQSQFEVLLDANNATWIGFLYALTVAQNKRYQMPFG